MLKCQECKWTGEWRECDCIYKEKQGVLKGEPVGEVELIDLCPVCGSSNLIEIEDDLVLA